MRGIENNFGGLEVVFFFSKWVLGALAELPRLVLGTTNPPGGRGKALPSHAGNRNFGPFYVQTNVKGLDINPKNSENHKHWISYKTFIFQRSAFQITVETDKSGMSSKIISLKEVVLNPV